MLHNLRVILREKKITVLIQNKNLEYHQKNVKNAEGRDAWVEAGRVRGSIYTYTVSGLQTKSEYLVRVRAINESGAGPLQEPDSLPTPEIS